MPKRIGDEKKRDVVRNYLKGDSRRDNSGKTGVAAGSVSNIVNGFEDRARASSLGDALAELGLDEELKGIRSLSQLISASGAPPEHVIRHALELYHLQERYRLSYPEVIEDYQAKQNQLMALNNQVTELKNQQAELRATINKLESKRQSMEYTITEYTELKRRLKEQGFSIYDLDTLISVLKSMKQLGSDPELLNSYLKRTDTLLESFMKLVKNNASLEKKILQQKIEIDNNNQKTALQKSIYEQEKKKLRTLRENEFMELRWVQTQAEAQINANHSILNQLSKETAETTADMLNQLDEAKTMVKQITTEFTPLASLHPLHQLLTTGQGNPLVLSFILGIILSKYRQNAMQYFKSPNLDMAIQNLIDEMSMAVKIQ